MRKMCFSATCHFGQVRALEAFPIQSYGEAYAAIRVTSPGNRLFSGLKLTFILACA